MPEFIVDDTDVPGDIWKFTVPVACEGLTEAVKVADWPIVIGVVKLRLVVVGDLFIVIVWLADHEAPNGGVPSVPRNSALTW